MTAPIIPLHLSAADGDAIITALVVAGIARREADGYVEVKPEFTYVYLGRQSFYTGTETEQEDGSMVAEVGWYPGVWGAVFGPVSEEQREVLPLPDQQPVPAMVTM